MRCRACQKARYQSTTQLGICGPQSPTHLGDNFGVGIEIQESPRELGCGGSVVRAREHLNRAPERDLHVWWLQIAVREVRSQFQAPANIVRFLLGDTTTLEFERNTKQVLSCDRNGISPLPVYQSARTRSIKKINCANLFSLIM